MLAVFKARLFRLRIGPVTEECVVTQVKADPRKEHVHTRIHAAIEYLEYQYILAVQIVDTTSMNATLCFLFLKR